MRGIAFAMASLFLVSGLAYAEPGSVEVEFEGQTVSISYDAEGVSVLSANAISEAGVEELILNVDVDGASGVLEVTIDRSFMDSTFGGTDAEFVVLVDGDNPSVEETETGEQSRTLRIEIPFGTEEINIINIVSDEPEQEVPEEPEIPAEPEPPREPESPAATEVQAVPEIPAEAAVVEPGSVEVEFEGETVSISYDADGVSVLSADVDIDELILDVDVDGTPGILEIIIERSFMDSTFEGTDEGFVVIVDGEDSSVEETETTGQSRTIRFELPFGTEQVSIINTSPTPDEPEVPIEPEIPPEAEPPIEPEIPDEPEVPEEPEIPAEPPVDEPGSQCGPGTILVDGVCVLESEAGTERQCGPGTVLVDGVCVLDESCGPGTILVDGVCVLEKTENRPAGNYRDLAWGIGVAFVISFVLMVILRLMGGVGRGSSR